MSSKKMTPSSAEKQVNMLSALMDQIRLVWYLLTDGKVSLLTKAIIPVALLYVISPIDFIPDVILGLGQLDDLGVILLGLTLFVKLSPPDVVEYYRKQIEYGDSDEMPVIDDDDDTVDTTYRIIDED